MNTLLLCMVGLSFIVAMLTAGRESQYGIRDEELKNLK